MIRLKEVAYFGLIPDEHTTVSEHTQVLASTSSSPGACSLLPGQRPAVPRWRGRPPPMATGARGFVSRRETRSDAGQRVGREAAARANTTTFLRIRVVGGSWPLLNPLACCYVFFLRRTLACWWDLWAVVWALAIDFAGLGVQAFGPGGENEVKICIL
jgi:hypothetical protein